MRTSRSRLLLSWFVLALTSVVLTAQTSSDQIDRRGRVAVFASTSSEIQIWEATIDRMVRNRQLVVLDSRDDPDIGGRRLESLGQYYQGIPVFGASLSRQSAP